MMEVKKVVLRAEASKDYQKVVAEMEFEVKMDEQFYPELHFYQDMVNNEAKNQLDNLLNLVKDDNEEPVKPVVKEEEIDEAHRPTAKQIEICEKYGLPIPKTKAAASEIIRNKLKELSRR